MFDRRTFFAYARRAPFGGRLSSAQVDGLTRILDAWDASHLTDMRWLAYMLATAFHETGAVLQPIRERGGEAYLRSRPYYPWVGEGLVQVTWERNHRLFGASRPGQLLTWDKALPALFRGMEEGLFTGRRLADYFSAVKDDPVGARRIVNGTDKTRLIAGYHRNFLDALRAADKATPQPADVAPDAAEPDDVRPAESPAALTTGGFFAGGVAALPALGGITNGWALAALGLVLAAGGIAAWLVLSGRVTIRRSPA